MNNNTIPAYWEQVHNIEPNAARHLALIAGDYANMPDSEVFATFINDNAEVFEKFPKELGL